MKFDPAKPVVTKGGLPARIICTDREGSDAYSVVALLNRGSGVETLESFTNDGKYYGPESDSRMDLVNIPEKHTRYLNIYPDSRLHLSREIANKGAVSDRLACIKVEWEAGQWDD